MRFLLSVLLLSTCAPSFGAFNGYLDMESGTNRQAVTTTILNAATHATGGWWSVNTPLTHFMVSTSFETPLLHPVTIGGSTFNDTGSTRTFVYTNTAYREYATYSFAERPTKLSFGLYMRLSGFQMLYNSFDFVTVEGNGEFMVVNFQDDSSGFAYRVHTLDVDGVGATKPGLGAAVPVRQDKTYWVTCLWDKTNLLATLKVYDPATWLLVGTSTNPILSRDAENIIIGRYDEHGSALENASTYFDDLIWDVTGATYPLFPTSRPVDVPKTVTFDDLSPGTDWTLISGGHEGLQWYCFGALNGSLRPEGNGYRTGMISPGNVAFNAGGNTAIIWTTTNSFDLHSAYLTAASAGGLQLRVQGFRWPASSSGNTNAASTNVPPLNGLILAYDKTYALNARAPTLIQFDYRGVSEVRFIPSSPLQFVMDNLEVTVHQIPTLSIRITGVSSSTGTALYVQGQAGRTNVVEASADLVRWTPISTNVMPFTLCPVCPSVNVTDSAVKNSGRRFYRAVELP